MKMINVFSLILVFIITFTNVNAQSENKDVYITVSGSGKTFEEAIQSALRSAIEQAFGAFISSKTEMFNDQIVADQMASVSSGNIKSYEILNQDQRPDGRWGVTLKTIVSVDKLTSFVQAKGINIEIKGGLFALNIKQQLLNEQAEFKLVTELVGLLHEPMQISFDYEIKGTDPVSLDAQSINWKMPFVLTATANNNIDFCANYFIKTLTALSLSSEDVKNYQSLNKAIYPVTINYKGVDKTFYLRQNYSIALLETLISRWKFYLSLFTVQSGMDVLNFKADGYIHDFGKVSENSNGSKRTNISFLTAGKKAGTWSFSLIKTLSQIEQMTGLTVKPIGVVSQYKHGGFVVYENNGHGFVAAVTRLRILNWASSKTYCDNLIFNGYSDWSLPTKEELNAIYLNLSKKGITYPNGEYWSSTEYGVSQAWRHDFSNAKQSTNYKDNLHWVLAVRHF